MALSELQLKILGYISKGMNTLADIADNTGLSAPDANDIIEQMELDGYLVKGSYTSIERFNFYLTDKGVEFLPELSEEEKILQADNLSLQQYRIINYVNGKDGCLAAELVKDLGIDGMELVSDLRYLVDGGFLSETGMLRRKMHMAAKGAEALNKYKDQIKIPA